MAKGKDTLSDMAQARQSDGIHVIFDQDSPASSRSRSKSSGRSSVSDRYRGRDSHRGRYRSPSSSTSSSSSSRSSSRSRSRSHPRCHRRSSRCRCDDHHRYGRGRYRHSPAHHRRAQSRSCSRLPTSDRYSRHRRYRSRSRSSSPWYRTAARRFTRSPPRTYRSRSRSRSSGRSVSLSLDDKRELLKAAKANAMKILGVEKLELPESVKPLLSEQLESKWVAPPESSDVEPDMSSPTMSPKKISFSINNSVVRPAVAAPSCAKVTPRVDIYESRKPYGHWIPVKSGQTNARKHTYSTSH
ncbi:arginine/serine-rich protein 1 isoform X2 [Micropterus dolomieu]|uniref:arginine/serine-rich protein 1 isoform X2 n=1 Tax=Micropterus dolomieu TaxID=147949 RepID=UPI001E8E2D5E|nr:arginine/serine-rich protein 1 isoform X2 [Micropterus dolomieu]